MKYTVNTTKIEKKRKLGALLVQVPKVGRLFFRLDVCLALVGLVMLGLGCSSPKPYVEQESWLIRENARPHYFALYDIFYLAATNYEGKGEYPYEQHGKAITETVDQFGIHTRVFAPVYHDAEDVEESFQHYLDMYHGNGLPLPFNKDDRPFVFIGEGKGAELLIAFVEDNKRKLRKKGFLGGWYSPDTTNGFVTEQMVQDVSETVKAEVYRRTWGRDVQ